MRQARLGHQRIDLRAQGPGAAIAMVAVIKCHQVEPPARKQPQASGQIVDFIQIKQQRKQAIAQPVHARAQPMVHDVPHIQRRRRHQAAFAGIAGRVIWIRPDSSATCQGRRTPPISSATASPACNPSS